MTALARPKARVPKSPGKKTAAKPAEPDARYVLKLYVAGASPMSARAIQNIRTICEEHLKGRYSLEVINIYERPALAKGEQIIAAPTLVKKLPVPLRRFIGDMSDLNKVLIGLDLRPDSEK